MVDGKPKVYFRADGNSTMGLGHLVRSLALAEMLSEYFQYFFIIRATGLDLKSTVLQSCSNVIEIPEMASTAEEIDFLKTCLKFDDTLVLDGYHFDSDYQISVKGLVSKLVCIDDLAATFFHADLIINHCGGNVIEKYKAQPYSKFCVGPAYALLRKSFREKNLSNIASNDDRLLICMGGSDPNNDTLKMLAQVSQSRFSHHRIAVVVGAAYRFFQDLQNFCNIYPQLSIDIFKNLSEVDLRDLMQECGVAICSASTIAYEYCSVGGVLYLIKTQSNQSDLFNFLTKDELALKVDFLNDIISNEATRHMLNTQRQHFDGNYGSRLIDAFLELEREKEIELVIAAETDLMQYFHWANDEGARNNSISKAPIDVSTHSIWFTNKLRQKDSHLFIAKIKGTPIGNIRFDLRDEYYVISYMVDQNFRGQGMGTRILKLGLEKICAINLEKKISFKAVVQTNNTASIKIFTNFNFVKVSNDATLDENFTTFSK